MFLKGGQTRKHCFLAMFIKGGQKTRKYCFLAMIHKNWAKQEALFSIHISQKLAKPGNTVS
jgi:hypothetical protein